MAAALRSLRTAHNSQDAFTRLQGPMPWPLGCRNALLQFRITAAMNTPKHVIKLCDMPPDMERDAIEISMDGLDNLGSEKEVAQFLRKAFVDKYQGVWHCIVGRNFGSYVTHEAKHHIYFYAGQTAVLLFKTG